MIELRNVSKSFKNGKEDRVVLNINSIVIPKGKVTAIIGPSGCGKTTLLNIIGALENKYSGLAIIGDITLNAMNEKQKNDYRRENIGYIFQNYNLISYLNVYQNIEIALNLNKVRKNLRKEKINEILKKFDLEKIKNSKPSEISGGEKQRVALARALINDPDIILADEPTGALDYDNSIKILKLLNQVAKEGKTVIIVSHNKEVELYSDQIISIRDGQVEKVEIKQEYENTISKLNYKHKKSINILTSLRIALNSILKKKVQTFFVSFGAAIGICGLVSMIALGNGVETKVQEELNKIIEETEISVKKQYGVSEEFFSDAELTKIQSITGVKTVFKSYDFSVEIIDYPNKTQQGLKEINIYFNQVLQPKTYSQNFIDNNILIGEYPSDNEMKIIVTKNIAQQLTQSSNNYNTILGKTIKLNFSYLEPTKDSDTYNSYDVKDLEFEVVGIAKDGPFNMELVYIPLNIVEDKIKQATNKEYVPTKEIKVLMNSKDDIENVKKSLKSLNYEVVQDEDMIKDVKNISDGVQMVLGLISIIALFISSIMIGVVKYISTYERSKEIGILRAIGAKQKDIRKIFSSESILIGLISGLLGIGLAIVISIPANKYFGNILFDEPFTVFKFDIKILIFSLLGSALISYISSIIPSIRAAKLDPIQALRIE